MVIRRNSFFFLFPFSYYHGPTFFSGRLAKNLSWREDKGSRTKRGAFFPWKFSFNYRGVVCLAICLHFLFLFSPPLPRGSKLTFSRSLLPRISIIRMDKFVTLNETRTRTPRVHVCEITKRKAVSRQRKYTRGREGISIRSGKRKF